MSVNIRQRSKPKRPMGKIYESSKLREWAKYWDCRQRDVRDAAKMSGRMVVDIQNWLRVNVPHWVAPRRILNKRPARRAMRAA
jgi:hypothetical protein